MADAKPAVERLSEDESLRGDLSDIGFGPLLDWAIEAVEAYAPKAADGDALDAYTSRVRGVVQAAVQAAQDSKLDDPEALLDFDPADREKVLAALKAFTFGDDPDENGSQLAAALQTGLASSSSSSPEATSPTPPENPPGSKEASPPEAAPAQEIAPQKEQSQAQPQATPSQEAASTPETAQPAPAAVESLKKNEQAGVNASPPIPDPNPEPPANPVPTNPRPGGFLGDLRSRMGQAYNSAWGVFKGLSRRRSG